MYKEYEEKVLLKLQKVQLEILKDFIEVCEKHNLVYFMTFGSAIGAVRHNGFIPWDDDIDVGMLRDDYDKFLDIAKNELSSKYNILTPKTNENYASTVTHLEKNNTKFISEFAKDLKCNIGINIDIFVFDNIADDINKRKKQVREAWFWGRLLFLRGTAHPEISIKGIIGLSAKIICMLVHYALVLFRVPAPVIYNKLLKVSIKYNHLQTSEVTCFEDPAPLNNMIVKKNIFPLREEKFENITVKIPFENDNLLTRMYGDYMKVPPPEKRINHCPYIIDFGDDEKI